MGVARMAVGRLRQREAPTKLNALCPNEDLTKGSLSWEVEEERVFWWQKIIREEPRQVRWSLGG